MKVLHADILGYCMGVRRAVETACNALDEYASKNVQNGDQKGAEKRDNPDKHEKPDKHDIKREVFTFGPLIHNRMALESLSVRGLSILTEDKIDLIDKENPPVVIIRAHGVPPVIREKLESKNCTIIDATCPRVLASQRLAAERASKGYTVIIAGDKQHGEVTGISGCALHAGQKAIVLENRLDAERLSPYPQKAVLISQTTISRSEYDAIADVLRLHISDLKVFDSICPATLERQKALEELCTKVDGVLVIGGKNSANTQRLYTTALEKCSKAALIESPDEIPSDFFALDRVGLSAGASTPDEVIDSVEERLLKNE